LIEITFLGVIVATLASAFALAFLLGVLFASAYVLATAAEAIEALPPPAGHLPVAAESARRKRFSFWITVLAFVLAFASAVSLIGVGGTGTTLLFSLALASVCRSGAKVCLSLGARARDVRETRLRLRAASSSEAQRATRARLEADAARKLSGDDLRAEVVDAEASIERLRDALSALRDTRAALGQKLAASVGTNAPSKLDPGSTMGLRSDKPSYAPNPEVAKLRDELGLRIDLGQKVLFAAEAAAFRLACAVPLKKLVRRRPQEVAALDPRGEGDLGARVAAAIVAVDAYLASIVEARAELDEIAQRRPTLPPPGEEELSPDPAAPLDPLDRTSRDIDAIERAYRSLRDRLELLRLGLQARAGMAEVTSAAGEVSAKAAANGLSERELAQLVDDLTRAERATSVELGVPDEDLRALAEVLARGTSALDRDDRASLGEVVEALGELG